MVRRTPRSTLTDTLLPYTPLGRSGHGPRLLAAALVHAPAALVVVGVTFALYGFVPRFAVAGWALVAALFVMGFFGDILSLPEWFLELSPFHHVPSLPAEDVAVLPLVLLSVLEAALIGLGLGGFARRDLQTWSAGVKSSRRRAGLGQ